jgi:hypothetical protein
MKRKIQIKIKSVILKSRAKRVKALELILCLNCQRENVFFFVCLYFEFVQLTFYQTDIRFVQNDFKIIRISVNNGTNEQTANIGHILSEHKR